MKQLLHSRSFYVSIALGVIGLVVAMMVIVQTNQPPERITTTAETGPVRQIVSVSGIAEAEQTAELAFPVSGIVRSVAVREGDVVAAGDILISLESQALSADRQDALAAISRATADRDELLSGPTGSARDVTERTLEQAKARLATTQENEARRVENAYRTLLSSDLTAYSDDAGEDAVAPTVSGTYTCGDEGKYRLEVFRSNTPSGYSYSLSGIESGTYTASVQQPFPLGECGLRVLFDQNSVYGRTVWTIDIPNTKSPTYVTNRNAYALAVTQAESAIENAEQEVAVAEANARNQNAPAREEVIRRADASIAQAQARLARVNASLADRTLRAPFPGTITNVDVRPGETVSTAPVVTLLGDAHFEMTARVPEVDIGKLEIGQPVELRFDARSDETLLGEIRFISLTATEIDGVAYYEALISLAETPDWIRSGLNADIDIITQEMTDAVRIPTRFLRETPTGHEVLLQRPDKSTATTTVQLELTGNDGFVAVTGLTEGDTLIAP